MRKEALVALVGLALVTVACQKKAEAPAASAAQPAAPAAVVAAPAPVEAAPAVFASFGVPECDNYIQKYMECIDTKVPAEAREQIRVGFEATRTAWQQAASTEAGKAALATGCVQATEAAKAAMVAYGCTF